MLSLIDSRYNVTQIILFSGPIVSFGEDSTSCARKCTGLLIYYFIYHFDKLYYVLKMRLSLYSWFKLFMIVMDSKCRKSYNYMQQTIVEFWKDRMRTQYSLLL